MVFYNDHGLKFYPDKLPTFAVGAAKEYRSEDEGWGFPSRARSKAIRIYPGTFSMRWSPTNSTSPCVRTCWWTIR